MDPLSANSGDAYGPPQAPAPPTRPGLDNNSATGNSGGGGFNPWALAVPAAVGVASWFGNESTNEANSAEGAANRAFNAYQADRARDYDQAKTLWQAQNGYQNAVADMRKAGLNPAMMYAKGMGAESGSGGGPTAAGVGNPVHLNTMAPALSSAIQSAQMLNDLRNTDAEILLKQAQVVNQVTQGEANTWSARETEENIGRIARYSRALDIEYPAIKAEAKARMNEARLDLEHRARERILNQVDTGVSSAARLVEAAQRRRGYPPPRRDGRYFDENDMLRAAKGKGVIVK